MRSQGKWPDLLAHFVCLCIRVAFAKETKTKNRAAFSHSPGQASARGCSEPCSQAKAPFTRWLSRKLSFCEMPNSEFPPWLAIPQCPRPAQRQALSTRSTKLPLPRSQEQGWGEPQLREPLSSSPWLALFFPCARGSPCQGACTAWNSQEPCA